MYEKHRTFFKTAAPLPCGMRALLLATILLSGCAGSLSAPLKFTEFHRYQPPELSALIATTPGPTIAGDAAAFDGFLFTAADWSRVKAEHRRTVEQLRIAHEQLDADRHLAETEDAAKRAALKQCRQRKAEVFALGVALGVGGCAATERAVGAIAPQQ